MGMFRTPVSKFYRDVEGFIMKNHITLTKSHDKYKEDDAKPKQVVGNHPVYHGYEWPSCLETSEKKKSILLVNICMIGIMDMHRF